MNGTTRNSLNLIATNKFKHKRAHKENRGNTQLSKHEDKNKPMKRNNPIGNKNQLHRPQSKEREEAKKKGREKHSTGTLLAAPTVETPAAIDFSDATVHIKSWEQSELNTLKLKC